MEISPRSEPPWLALTDALTAWFALHRRDLPWRREREVYRTWLSEIMLQQTQVATVIDYYERFTTRFPTVDALAAADIDEVLSLWSGLGYYARGRNLHHAARAVVEQGGFPTTVAGLRALPGVGAYTAAAIAAQCHGARAAAIDGNVARVLSRLLDLDTEVDGEGRDDIERAARSLVELARDPRSHTEALMELGALVCTPRSPRCEACPWTSACAGQARAEALPKKRPKAVRKRVQLTCVVAHDDERVLLRRAGPGELFAGTYAPPWRQAVGELALAAMIRDLQLDVIERMPTVEVKRTLTHRELHIRITPVRARAGSGWRHGRELADLGISTAARAVLAAAWPGAGRFFGPRGSPA